MSYPHPANAISSIVSLIYIAALDHARWADVADRLTQLNNGAKTYIFGHDIATATAYTFTHADYDEAVERSYLDHYVQLNPYADSFARLTPGAVAQYLEVVPETKLTRTEFYNDWLRPQEDLIGGSGTVLARDNGRFVVAGAMFRRRDIERMGEGWDLLLGDLAPHMMQALDIARALAARDLAVIAAEAGMPRGAALILLRGDCGIANATPAAETLLAARDAVRRDRANRIVLPAAAQLAVASAADRVGRGFVAAPVTARIAAPDGQSWQMRTAVVDLSEISASPLVLPGAEGRLIMLALAPQPGPEVVQRVVGALGLTPAEAHMALAIADGQTLAEIAEAMAKSIHTVRNHAKAALSKAGVRRQAELALLLDRARRR